MTEWSTALYYIAQCSRGLLRFEFTLANISSITALPVLNSSPLKPVEYDEEAQKVNEAVRGDEYSTEVWQV